MPDIRVNFIHPTDGGRVAVTLDDANTTSEALANLVDAGFVNANPQGYNLGKKGGDLLTANQSLAQAGIKDGDELRVIPATDAG